MAKLTKKDMARIKELRSLFPSKILVSAHRSVEGGFFAEIANFPGCITEGDTFSELIEMVNDCVGTYLEIPKKYLSFMPSYIPPLKVAQDLDAFPNFKTDADLSLRLTSSEHVTVAS